MCAGPVLAMCEWAGIISNPFEEVAVAWSDSTVASATSRIHRDVLLSLLAEARQDARRVLRALDEIVQTEVFIRRVSAPARIADARRANRHIKDMHKGIERARAADDWLNVGRLAIDLLRRLGANSDKGVVGIDARGLCAAMQMDVDVAEALRSEEHTSEL